MGAAQVQCAAPGRSWGPERLARLLEGLSQQRDGLGVYVTHPDRKHNGNTFQKPSHRGIRAAQWWPLWVTFSAVKLRLEQELGSNSVALHELDDAGPIGMSSMGV